MNLNIIDNGTGQRDGIVKLLNQYGALSNIFKKRIGEKWRVDICSGRSVTGFTDKTDITVYIPPLQTTVTLRDVVETILFECGNASRSQVFQNLKKKFDGSAAPAISMLEYGNQYAAAEADNFWEFAQGLKDVQYNNFVLSIQGRKQLKSIGDKQQAQYMTFFKQTPQDPDSPDEVQRLSSVDMYAYEIIRDTRELKLMKILDRVVTGGNRRDLYDELIERPIFNNMSEGERIPVWCTILDTINKAMARSPGCWVKADGYDFSNKMLQVAMLKPLQVDTKRTLNDKLAVIKGALGIQFDTPHWLK
jgi:hypothetical protein